MRKLSALAFIIIIAAANAAFAQTTTRNVSLNKEFTLSANRKGFLKTGKITIEFVSVTEDSRCPDDVDCVWAGNAKIQIKLSKGKAAAQIFELNTGLEPQFITFQGYKIELLELSPTLKSDDDRQAVKYSAVFIVTR